VRSTFSQSQKNFANTEIPDTLCRFAMGYHPLITPSRPVG